MEENQRLKQVIGPFFYRKNSSSSLSILVIKNVSSIDGESV